MWTEKDREKYKDDGRRYPSDLTDVEWSIIEPLFRGYFTFTADMREVVNACFYLEHTGCQWRALPTNFGPHQTVGKLLALTPICPMRSGPRTCCC